jgi:NAD(P)-dependent dehydrogenase (short-subunit alcohol dehydrogenase family)
MFVPHHADGSLAGFRLDGLTAVVTGAGRGIGRACALALVGAGAEVLAVARTAADLESLARQAGPRLRSWCADVASDQFQQHLEQMNRLDILVNNVGTNRPAPFVDVTATDLDAVVCLNVRTAFRVAQSGVRAMRRAGHGGSVIHMSSQMGHVGAPQRTVYCMTKHAIEGLSKAMAVELAPEGIRVNCVAPTFIETPMTRPMLDDESFRADVLSRIPLGRLGQPGDIASAVVFLASPAAALITGDSLKIDGGWTAR